jgi:hypothetical protein
VAIGRYVEVRVGETRHRIPTHIAVWIYHHGSLPKEPIVFRDGNNGDCRIANLMERSARRTAKEQFLWTQWRMTPAQYDALVQAQGGVCAICEKPETLVRFGEVDRLSIDHCHIGMRVRGLLCANCNNGLGRFCDDPAILRKAADYLERQREGGALDADLMRQKAKWGTRPRAHSPYGVGVSRRGNRYRAKIMVNYRPVHLGYFATAEEARAAYAEAAAKFNGTTHVVSPSIAG